MEPVFLPLCHYPSSVFFVDDDKLFLDAMRLAYSDYFRCMTFCEPKDAQSALSSYYKKQPSIFFTQELVKSDEYGTYDHLPVDINLSGLMDLANYPEKTYEPSVIVIDYNMPVMNGLQFCEKIRHLPCKKVLLTGDASHEKAVEAFNRGLIDKFVRKDYYTTDLLSEYIFELSELYFYNKTSHLINHLSTANHTPLTDNNFIRFFKYWCKQNHIREYYLINRFGSFLTKDVNGDNLYFIVLGEKEIRDFIKNYEEVKPKIGHLLDALSDGKQIPFFGINTDGWQVSLDSWENFFFPAQIMIGERERYIWGVVKESCLF